MLRITLFQIKPAVYFPVRKLCTAYRFSGAQIFTLPNSSTLLIRRVLILKRHKPFQMCSVENEKYLFTLVHNKCVGQLNGKRFYREIRYFIIRGVELKFVVMLIRSCNFIFL